MFLKYSTAILLVACSLANAEETISNEVAFKKPKEPIFFFELPYRGALAAFIDKGAIKIGSSGSIKGAKSIIEIAAAAKGSLLLSCKNTHSALAIEKSLSSFADGSLPDLTFILTEKEKCSERLVNAIARVGADL